MDYSHSCKYVKVVSQQLQKTQFDYNESSVALLV